MGCHRSVVVCATYKWEIMGLIPGWAELCSNIVLLGKALCPYVHSLNPGVGGYLVGQWRLVCLNSSVHWKWQLGYMPPGGSWDGLWMHRSCDQGVIVWSQVSSTSRYQTINLHLYLYLYLLMLSHRKVGRKEMGAAKWLKNKMKQSPPNKWATA